MRTVVEQKRREKAKETENERRPVQRASAVGPRKRSSHGSLSLPLPERCPLS